jgi:hypothetical protein
METISSIDRAATGGTRHERVAIRSLSASGEIVECQTAMGAVVYHDWLEPSCDEATGYMQRAANQSFLRPA